MLSCGLVGTWGYYIYDKAHMPLPGTAGPVVSPHIDSLAISKGVADSLDRIYQDALRSLGTELDSTNTEKVCSDLSYRQGWRRSINFGWRYR